MTTIMKALLGISTLTGSCCAVGIPIAMSSNSEKVSELKDLTSTQLLRCPDNHDFREISLNDNEENSFCFRGEVVTISDESEGSQIFRSIRGNKPTGVGLVENSQAYCRMDDTAEDAEEDENNGHGSLGKDKGSSNPCNGTKYLELKQKNYGIKDKIQTEQSKAKAEVQLCLNDCGETRPNLNGNSETASVKEKTANGHSVKFYVG